MAFLRMLVAGWLEDFDRANPKTLDITVTKSTQENYEKQRNMKHGIDGDSMKIAELGTCYHA
jgi:hypothetical protein